MSPQISGADARQGRFSIGEASALTGINPVTLRAWERRYGLIQPHRTGKGHRFYEDDDIRRIRQITGWLERGVAISRVRALLEQSPVALDTDGADPWRQSIAEGMAALADFDVHRLERLFNSLQRQYPLERLLDDWLEPMRAELRGFSDRPAAELFDGALVSFLQAKLGVRLLSAGRGRQRVAVIADRREGALDALLQAAQLRERGINAFWLDATVSHDSLPLLMSGRNVAALLLVLAPGATQTAVSRLIGAIARHADGGLLLSGSGLLALDRQPDGATVLPSGRAAVADALVGWLEQRREHQHGERHGDLQGKLKGEQR